MALTPLKTGEGLRGDLREGNEGEVVTVRWHPRRGAGRARWPGSGGSWRWGMELTAGARLIERRGRGGRLGRREPKGKAYFARRRDRRAARWAGRDGFGLQGRRVQWAGWARGRVGRKVGRAKNKEKGISELKIGFLNLPRLWKFVEGDLGGILT
jgi:hypothetical protein